MPSNYHVVEGHCEPELGPIHLQINWNNLHVNFNTKFEKPVSTQCLVTIWARCKGDQQTDIHI